MPIERKHRTASHKNEGMSRETITLFAIIGSVVIIGMVFLLTALAFLLRQPDGPPAGGVIGGGWDASSQVATETPSSPAVDRRDDLLKKTVGMVVPCVRFLAPTRTVEKFQSRGTGFLISPDGYFLTNHHVVEPYLDFAPIIDQLGTRSITVGEETGRVENLCLIYLDGIEYEASVVGRAFDDKMDFALLKISPETPLPSGNPYLRFHPNAIRGGTMISSLAPVLAIGFPGGADVVDLSGDVNTDLSELFKMSNAARIRDQIPGTAFVHSATQGIVSKVVEPRARGFEIIVHDALISPGNSGGPLLDKNGFVVGINTRINKTDVGIVGSQANSIASIYPRIARYLGTAQATPTAQEP